jgi:hypothetical protein
MWNDFNYDFGVTNYKLVAQAQLIIMSFELLIRN